MTPRPFALVFLLLLLAPLSAVPPFQKLITLPPDPQISVLPKSTLGYTLSWNGRVKAGELELKFDQPAPQGYYRIDARGGSTGWARLLYPFSFHYRGDLDAKSHRARRFSGSEVEKGEQKIYRNTFTANRVVSLYHSVEKGQQRPTTETIFQAVPLHDLFTALLQVRSLPLRNGDIERFVLFPVGKPYLAQLMVEGRENYAGRPAIRLQLKLQKITPKGELAHYKKLKTATLWISDDNWRVPFEVRAQVFIGDVRISLTKWEAK